MWKYLNEKPTHLEVIERPRKSSVLEPPAVLLKSSHCINRMHLVVFKVVGFCDRNLMSFGLQLQSCPTIGRFRSFFGFFTAHFHPSRFFQHWCYQNIVSPCCGVAVKSRYDVGLRGAWGSRIRWWRPLSRSTCWSLSRIVGGTQVRRDESGVARNCLNLGGHHFVRCFQA